MLPLATRRESMRPWTTPAAASKAIGEAELLSPFKHDADAVWVVGMDSSRLAFRCLRLASMLMDVKSGKHHLLVLSIQSGDANENLTLSANCQEEARKCNVPRKNYAFKTLMKPNDWSVGETLIYYANKCAGLKARLVIGAQGMRRDTYSGESSMDWIGSIAAECMAKVKVPLTVVKQPWRDVNGQRNALGRVMRCGRNGLPGLNYLCCVDDTQISHQTFAFATQLLRPADELTVFYVAKSVKDADIIKREASLRNHYTAECSKLMYCFQGLKNAERAPFCVPTSTQARPCSPLLPIRSENDYSRQQLDCRRHPKLYRGS